MGLKLNINSPEASSGSDWQTFCAGADICIEESASDSEKSVSVSENNKIFKNQLKGQCKKTYIPHGYSSFSFRWFSCIRSIRHRLRCRMDS